MFHHLNFVHVLNISPKRKLPHKKKNQFLFIPKNPPGNVSFTVSHINNFFLLFLFLNLNRSCIVRVLGPAKKKLKNPAQGKKACKRKVCYKKKVMKKKHKKKKSGKKKKNPAQGKKKKSSTRTKKKKSGKK